MLRWILLLSLTMGFSVAAERPSKAAKRSTGEPPKEAVQLSPGVYRHTDSSGKDWEYRKTPFGWQKAEAKEAALDDRQAPPAPSGATRATPFGDVKTPPQQGEARGSAGPEVVAVEDGDSIRFERQSPFGPYRWTRKKSELTAAEEEVWQRTKSDGSK